MKKSISHLQQNKKKQREQVEKSKKHWYQKSTSAIELKHHSIYI